MENKQDSEKWREKCKVKLKKLRITAKKRARRKKIEFTILCKDLNIPIKCPILGIEMDLKFVHKDGSPTLDRLDPSKGYVKGNVWVISKKANEMKGCTKIEDMIPYCKSWIDFDRNKN